MSRCRINKLRFERKEEAHSVFTSRGSRLCLPTALWQTGLGRNVPSASPHPPTHTAGRAASRGNAPGRTWKDLEGPYASGRAAPVRALAGWPRPGWLAAPLILVRFLPTRFATVAFFLLGWEWLASRLAAVPGTRPRSQRSG